MQEVQNIYKLKKYHPLVFDWFMDERLNILIPELGSVLRGLKSEKNITSNMIASVDVDFYPWPLLVCKIASSDDQRLIPFRETDSSLFTALALALEAHELNLSKFTNLHSRNWRGSKLLVKKTCLIAPQFNQLPDH